MKQKERKREQPNQKTNPGMITGANIYSKKKKKKKQNN